MKKIILLASVVFLAACATSSKIATPTQKDVDRVQSKYPGYSLAELSQGKALFTQYCGKCHKYVNPKEKSEEKWTKVVPAMVKKVNGREGKTALDAKGQDLILKYVITMRNAK